MASTLPEVVLTPSDIPSDIPGADLKEPFEAHTVPALSGGYNARYFCLCYHKEKVYHHN